MKQVIYRTAAHLTPERQAEEDAREALLAKPFLTQAEIDLLIPVKRAAGDRVDEGVRVVYHRLAAAGAPAHNGVTWGHGWLLYYEYTQVDGVILSYGFRYVETSAPQVVAGVEQFPVSTIHIVDADLLHLNGENARMVFDYTHRHDIARRLQQERGHE